MGSSEANTNTILALMERPYEPRSFPKGNNNNIIFHLPDEYVEERFRYNEVPEYKLSTVNYSYFKPESAVVLSSPVPPGGGGGAGAVAGVGNSIYLSSPAVKTEVVDIPKAKLPDLELAKSLDKDAVFSVFNQFHMQCAEQLLKIFITDTKGKFKEFASIAAYCLENLNPELVNYAMSIALLHRDDTPDADLPPAWQYFPAKYFSDSTCRKIRREAEISRLFPSKGNEDVIIVKKDHTATDLDPEHRIHYFREDLGVNLHHWHFHIVYPHKGEDVVVKKDRRGELFYYMHHQILARYNFERLCNVLPRVKRLLDFRSVIEEAYYPKISSRAGRARNTVLGDINRDGSTFDIHDLELWRNRLYAAVDSGYYLDQDGERKKFKEDVGIGEERGIDILGNLVESSSLSKNPRYYGSIHNYGHDAISYAHDPDERYLEVVGVMGDNTTAVRDPVFYRWHAFIDDIFENYKDSLDSYTVDQLTFKNMKIEEVEVVSINDDSNKKYLKNYLHTYWQESIVRLEHGFDFKTENPIKVQISHLQHIPFEYRIKVNNSGDKKIGTVRIFIGPESEEQGHVCPINVQKNLMVELDKFTYELKNGDNLIVRQSEKSSVTIPFERTFGDPMKKLKNMKGNDKYYCGCGWPSHMLIPKGNSMGFKSVLFVMISDYNDDKVPGADGKCDSKINLCDRGISYCGLKNSLYPDRKAMGYPFDRSVRRPEVKDMTKYTIKHFVNGVPNMSVTDVKIKHHNITIGPGKRFSLPTDELCSKCQYEMQSPLKSS